MNTLDDLRKVVVECDRFGVDNQRRPTDEEVIHEAVEIICNARGMAPPWVRRQIGRPRL